MDLLCRVGDLIVAGLQAGIPGYTYRYTDSGTGQGESGKWVQRAAASLYGLLHMIEKAAEEGRGGWESKSKESDSPR